MDNTLYLFNTLHRRKEPFQALNPPDVSLYTCGPTVYNYAHIGNLRAYIFADILHRTLIYNGYEVVQIINITDVGHLTSDADEGEDKIEKGAKRERKTVWEVAEHFSDAFKLDIKKLNILPPTKWVKATDHIQEQIHLIKTLEKKGFTYTINDGVYFDTSKITDYGKLALLDKQNLQQGARVTHNEQKKNITDFALWKFSPTAHKRAMEWESPWGIGFPGWHIECSAMSMKYLGETFDIHTGGIDHVPVHHTNEIAQSESATGKPLARYWMHNEHILLESGEKMAKSSNNFLRLQALLDKGYNALDYRFLCLNSTYRTQLKFSWPALDAAKEGRSRINQFAGRIYDIIDLPIKKSNEKYLSDKQDLFLQTINDDLNTPSGLAIIFEMIKDINSQIDNKTLSVSPQSIWEFLLKTDQVLGLNLESLTKETPVLTNTVQELLAQRQLARDNNDWEKSDRLRDQIKDLGFIVEDTDQGQKIKTI